ncbi:hypothetical protein V6N13_002026 [Hibiscus sabdariffa]
MRGRMKTSELSWNSQGETPLEIKPSIENMLKEGRSKNSAEEDPLAEAKATFEVCENLGLLFKAEKEVVVEKLLEIEKRMEN